MIEYVEVPKGVIYFTIREDEHYIYDIFFGYIYTNKMVIVKDENLKKYFHKKYKINCDYIIEDGFKIMKCNNWIFIGNYNERLSYNNGNYYRINKDDIINNNQNVQIDKKEYDNIINRFTPKQKNALKNYEIDIFNQESKQYKYTISKNFILDDSSITVSEKYDKIFIEILYDNVHIEYDYRNKTLCIFKLLQKSVKYFSRDKFNKMYSNKFLQELKNKFLPEYDNFKLIRKNILYDKIERYTTQQYTRSDRDFEYNLKSNTNYKYFKDDKLIEKIMNDCERCHLCNKKMSIIECNKKQYCIRIIEHYHFNKKIGPFRGCMCHICNKYMMKFDELLNGKSIEKYLKKKYKDDDRIYDYQGYYHDMMDEVICNININKLIIYKDEYKDEYEYEDEYEDEYND